MSPVALPAAVPFAVVGASFRRASLSVRSRLLRLERSSAAPSQRVVEAGLADGVVFIETCSRVDWFISSTHPVKAAQALSAELGVSDGVHTRVGAAAVQYLMRVVMGLDSVAEGETAIGRQVLKAFERAQQQHTLDSRLRNCFSSLQRAVAIRRKLEIDVPATGLEQLVVRSLPDIERTVSIPILGTGTMAHSVLRALEQAGYAAQLFSRGDVMHFVNESQSARVAMVCTAAPNEWVDLPENQGATLFDLGAPRQVRQSPGWAVIDLDALLKSHRNALTDEQRAMLGDAGFAEAARLVTLLSAVAPTTNLEVERRQFLQSTLPELLEGLAPDVAEAVRKACTDFSHTLLSNRS